MGNQSKSMLKKVVVIGGGNGSMCSISALKSHRDVFDISAVISMSDSGGSSGRLREEYKTTPPGDIMRAVLAMSPHDLHTMKDMFYRRRFKNCGKLDGHNLGNLFLVWAEQYAGDFMSAVSALEQAVGAVGRVYPCTTEITDLAAELSDGTIMRGEAALDRPLYDRGRRIRRAWLEPKPRAHDLAVKALSSADYIVIGPGSLYCSLIATLLPLGIKEAISESRAKIIFVPGNKYEKHGETGPVILSEYIAELERYLPRPADLVVYDNSVLTNEQSAFYEKKQWGIIAFDEPCQSDARILARPYEKPEGGLSPELLGKILYGIIATSYGN